MKFAANFIKSLNLSAKEYCAEETLKEAIAMLETGLDYITPKLLHYRNKKNLPTSTAAALASIFDHEKDGFTTVKLRTLAETFVKNHPSDVELTHRIARCCELSDSIMNCFIHLRRTSTAKTELKKLLM